ncbi:MAG: hypothetical protein KA536_11550 [Saprospiraceae bacterium]|nr:hypothetical protein [Saprospiraceae bacterium]
MTPIIKYRILIVDDNPFPTRECCGILFEKLENHFGKTFDHTLQEYYCNDYNALQTEYHNIDGKSFDFIMDDDVSVSIYNYNPKETKEFNQEKIIEIIKNNNINIFWTDSGYSNFRMDRENMFEETNGHPATADELIQNEIIIEELIKNHVRQVAMYSYNPKLTYFAIDQKKENIRKSFKSALTDDDIYVLETSPILNLFDNNDRLSAGNEKDNFLGTLNAFKYYGKLLGNVLFDLFLQIKEIKEKQSENKRRYNFFNPYNSKFLRYFKLINSDLINKFKDFQIGMISFYGTFYGKEYFLIDVPYKEYYEKYDIELEKGNPAKGTIIDLIDTDNIQQSKKWLHFKYGKNNQGKFIGCCNLEESIKTRSSLVESYLPLLHTGIFYEPDFYGNNNFIHDNFNIINEEEFEAEELNSYIEIIYLFKKLNFQNMEGVSHFIVWRRVQSDSATINLSETVEQMWEKYYKLVEPTLEALLVNILQTEIQGKAYRNQKLDIAAYNLSHTYGSHQIPDTESYLKEIAAYLMNKDNFENEEYDNLRKYYEKQMNNYFSFMSNLMLATHTINKPFENFYFSEYKASNLVYDLKSRFFCGLGGSWINEENFLGRGINDGKASSILLPFLQPESILLPNGSIGQTFLIMLITNVFRNLKKHSISGTKQKLKEMAILKPFYNGTFESRDFYSLDVKIEEPNEKLKDFYWKIRLIEKSRDYLKSPIEDTILLSTKVQELNNYMISLGSEIDGLAGFKEMRTLASALIAMPLEKYDTSNKGINDVFTDVETGMVYPAVPFSFSEHKENDSVYLSHDFYLRKEKFATIWVDNLYEDKAMELLKSGIELKQEGKDKKDIQSSSRFVLDLDSGSFNNISTCRKHYNFRFLKGIKSEFNLDNVIDLKNQIKSKWINSYLTEMGKIDCISKAIDGEVSVGSKKEIDGVGKKVLIDSHFGFCLANENVWANYDYIESNSSKALNCSMDNSDKDSSDFYMVREAILTDVYIYDEVLQDIKHGSSPNYNDPELKSKTFRETLLKKGIIIPSKEKMDLHDVFTGAESRMNLISFLEYIHESVKDSKVAYIIIHYSGFQKLAQRDRIEDIAKAMKDFSHEFKKESKYVVFTSGKNPGDLPNNVLFVDKDSLKNIICNRNSKFELIQLLNNIRFKA